MGNRLALTLNWTKDYDISWHRFEATSILKINVLQVPCHGNQKMRKSGVRLFSTVLFVLVYDDGQDLLKAWENAPVMRFHMDNRGREGGH